MKMSILSHIGTGIMALIMAVILWGFAYNQNLDEAKVSYRVQISAPQGVRMARDSVTVDLVVRGPRGLVEAFRNRPLGIIKKQITDAEVAGLEDTKTITLQVTRQDVNGDKRLVFAELPLPVTVEVSREDTRFLPLRFKTTGAPAPGFSFDPVRSFVRPVTVKVTGPKSVLDKADAIYTEDVNINGMSLSDRWDVPIVAKIDGKTVATDNTIARVYVALDRKSTTRTLKGIPVKVLAPVGYQYKIAIEPATVDVTVEGSEQAVVTLSPEQISVFAEVKAGDRPQESAYVPWLVVLVPPGLTAKAEPANVNLTVSAP